MDFSPWDSTLGKSLTFKKFLSNDLILVSSDFQGQPFTDRIRGILLYYEFWSLLYSLEILCYTPQELSKKSRQIGLVHDALEKGRILTFT